MKKLLVTGASGFLGWNVCRKARSDWTVYGTFCSRSANIPAVALTHVDLTRYNELKALFNTVKPAAVIHTAAVSNINFCQENREASYRINTEAAINIAGLCGDLEIPCLFTSSDLVFDGLDPPYSEEAEPSPVNVYGEHKVMAEFGMKKRCSSVGICRMPLMFGNCGPSASSFLQPLLRQMELGNEVKLFVDEFRTPLSAMNAVDGLMIALERLPGIVHLGGLERISRYEFGKLAAGVFNLPNAKLNPCRQRDLPMAAPRPADVSLNGAKAGKLGFQPETIKGSLQKLKGVVDRFSPER
jgi:dTDP-4-dehydrorhamnose reductase